MLEPTSYLRELRDVVKADEPELWQFFASAPRVSALVEDIREHLLRSAYRLDAAAHADLVAAAALAGERLGLTDPITLYQANDTAGQAGNATCLSMPGEVHVIFSGALLELLDGPELVAVLGHELAHHVLWSADGGEFWVLDRLVHASADDLAGTAVHEETSRLVRLHTELIADRGALLAAEGESAATITALVKLSTGLRSVSASAYLAQAKEVLDKDTSGSANLSHPETYLRALALDLWSTAGDESEPLIDAKLTGDIDLDALDLVAQHRLTDLTVRAVRDFLEPTWARTEEVVGHAKLFAAAAVPKARGARPAPVTIDDVAPFGPKIATYLAYVLLDLATVDEDLDLLAFAAACELSQTWGIAKPFDDVARKETGISASDLADRRAGSAALLTSTG